MCLCVCVAGPEFEPEENALLRRLAVSARARALCCGASDCRELIGK